MNVLPATAPNREWPPVPNPENLLWESLRRWETSVHAERLPDFLPGNRSSSNSVAGAFPRPEANAALVRRGRGWLGATLAGILLSNAAIFEEAARTSWEAPVRCATINGSVWMVLFATLLWQRRKGARFGLIAILLASAGAQALFLP